MRALSQNASVFWALQDLIQFASVLILSFSSTLSICEILRNSFLGPPSQFLFQILFVFREPEGRLVNGDATGNSSHGMKVERQLEPWDGGGSGDELENEVNGGRCRGIRSSLNAA